MQQGMDLRILPVLDRLLSTASITESARQLKLDPAQVSRALARARTSFGDELLVRSGRSMVLTRRGLELRGELRAILEQLDRAVQPDEVLDMRSVSRLVRIRCDDVFSGLLGARLHALLRVEAPGIHVHLLPERTDDDQGLREGWFDMVLGGGLKLAPETVVAQLGTERLVGICRKGHPLLSARITATALARHARVIADIQQQHEAVLMRAFRARGVTAEVALVTPTHFSVATAVAASDLIGTLPRALAWLLARPLGLELFALPAAPPPIRVVLAWHPRHARDPVHRWLRERVVPIVTAQLRTIEQQCAVRRH